MIRTLLFQACGRGKVEKVRFHMEGFDPIFGRFLCAFVKTLNSFIKHLIILTCVFLCAFVIHTSHHLINLPQTPPPCVFLGYPTSHRGYRCLDLATHKIIIISRHDTFDESSFPFLSMTADHPPSYSFLGEPSPITISYILQNTTTTPMELSSPVTNTPPVIESLSSPLGPHLPLCLLLLIPLRHFLPLTP